MTFVTKATASGAARRSEQAPSGMLAYVCHAGLWLNQIPTFDTEKPLG